SPAAASTPLPAPSSAPTPSTSASSAEAPPAPAEQPTATAAPSSGGAALATLVGDRIQIAKPIVFNPANDSISLPESQPVLDGVAALLAAHSSLRVEIRVHIDIKDEPGYGRKPSDTRAHRVMDYLVSRGIDAARLSAKGYGGTQPFTLGRTPKERAENRRTEF